LHFKNNSLRFRYSFDDLLYYSTVEKKTIIGTRKRRLSTNVYGVVCSKETTYRMYSAPRLH